MLFQIFCAERTLRQGLSTVLSYSLSRCSLLLNIKTEMLPFKENVPIILLDSPGSVSFASQPLSSSALTQDDNPSYLVSLSVCPNKLALLLIIHCAFFQLTVCHQVYPKIPSATSAPYVNKQQLPTTVAD